MKKMLSPFKGAITAVVLAASVMVASHEAVTHQVTVPVVAQVSHVIDVAVVDVGSSVEFVNDGVGCLLEPMHASAQITNMPDATVLYTSLQTPFSAALTWVIGATAVLVLIGWILKAVRRR
jgi:hypothetical protein